MERPADGRFRLWGGAIVGRLEAYDQIEYASAAAQVAGTVGMHWNVAILVPFLVVPLVRWYLPPGSIIVIMAFYPIIKATTDDTFVYLPAPLGDAAAGDVAWAWIRRSPG